MKVTKIHQAKINGVPAFAIEFDSGSVYMQRCAIRSASDDPMSFFEEMLVAFCERLVSPEEGAIAIPRETLERWIKAIEPYEVEGSYNNDPVIRTVAEMGRLLLPQSRSE